MAQALLFEAFWAQAGPEAAPERDAPVAPSRGRSSAGMGAGRTRPLVSEPAASASGLRPGHTEKTALRAALSQIVPTYMGIQLKHACNSKCLPAQSLYIRKGNKHITCILRGERGGERLLNGNVLGQAKGCDQS